MSGAAGRVLSSADARAMEACLARGGVVLFPTDTVYGLACDPHNPSAVCRLHTLKRRPAGKPSAVLFFDLEAALGPAGPGPDGGLADALRALLPGAVTVLVPNPLGRFPLACGPDPQTLGLRVPGLPPTSAALGGVSGAVFQSSANLAGRPEATRLSDVGEEIRRGSDLVLDGGPLPGVASTIVDLRRFVSEARWEIRRAGAITSEEVGRRLASHVGGTG